MSISAHRSQWIWTPVLGWALLSCSVSSALAQGAATQAIDTIGVGPGTSIGTSVGSGRTTTAIDPLTGAPVVVDGNAPVDANGVLSDISKSSGGSTTKPDQTTSRSVNPVTALPAISSPNNVGSSIGTSTITTTTTGPVSEVTTLPSYATTIVNAPFGTSIPVIPSIGGGGGGGPTGSELGITVGSFRLYPQLETNVGADSNVFAQNASQGTVGSLYTTVAPTLDLRSDWSNHELHLLAGGIAGFYPSATTQNYLNFTLQADGKIDIYSEFYARWSVAFKQNTEALGTPNVSFAQAPTVVTSIPIGLQLYQHFGRFFYDARGSATRYRYYDNSQVTSNGLPGSSRDRTEYEESVRLGYDVFSDLAFFIQPIINQRRYLNFINSSDQERNSDGQTLNFGATWTPSAATSLEGTVGYQRQVYQQFGPTSSFTFGLTGNWNGYAPLTLRPSIIRSIQETALSNYSSYVGTTYGLDFNYLIHDAWTAVGGVSLLTANYTPVPGAGVGPRTDTIYRGQIGLLYALRPQIQIGPFFEYTSGTSTDPINGPMYNREIFSVRLIAKR
ncbi:MAG: outer membrane beta-barrel protein [Proteobacteria bacterium]|nr:outer membrane beta-barrel protein [Pseudomonadota bacterium]